MKRKYRDSDNSTLDTQLLTRAQQADRDMEQLEKHALKQAEKAYSVIAVEKHQPDRIDTEVKRLLTEGKAYARTHARVKDPDRRAFNYLWEQISIYVSGHGRADLKYPKLKSQATVPDLKTHLLEVVAKWNEDTGGDGDEPRPPLTFFNAKQRNRLSLGKLSKQAEGLRQAQDGREARVWSMAQAAAAKKAKAPSHRRPRRKRMRDDITTTVPAPSISASLVGRTLEYGFLAYGESGTETHLEFSRGEIMRYAAKRFEFEMPDGTKQQVKANMLYIRWDRSLYPDDNDPDAWSWIECVKRFHGRNRQDGWEILDEDEAGSEGEVSGAPTLL